jgi:hypothetical protein
MLWIGLMWLRIGTSGKFLRAAQLAASQEGLSSMNE